MLRTAIKTSRSLSRRALIVGTSASAIGGACAYLTCSERESVRGLRRQAQFWSRVSPVIFDYYWNFASSSPYVKYREWKKGDGSPSLDGDHHDHVSRTERSQRLQELHRKHAPALLAVMLDLRGLYIKLGQVLSVTALPVPEAYREQFRTLQSDVSGWEAFDEVVKPLLEKELGCKVDDLFESIDEVPCGAASIGQAHKATLKKKGAEQDATTIILKVQYPDAAWQVPADIQCVGDLLRICVWAGVVDESASRLSFDDFSRQFLAELDYEAEKRNLKTVYKSSLDPDGPYAKHGVVIPNVLDDLCTPHILAMTYLPGPKLEGEAHRQLKMLGIDAKRNMRQLVVDSNGHGVDGEGHKIDRSPSSQLLAQAAKAIGTTIGIDNMMYIARWVQRILLLSTSVAVTTIGLVLPDAVTPMSWKEWSDAHQHAAKQAERLALTKSWMDALLDVHGHQVFQLGLFNADPHPGNILVIEEDDGVKYKSVGGDPNRGKNRNHQQPQLGLIDYGQCKRLEPEERARIARLILAVANDEPDKAVADAFRQLGTRTREDSTEFLAAFARLMFGPLRSEHMDREWHQRLHKMDKMDYFPRELSMVYRTALLLRGLALSLQVNASIADYWKDHAQVAFDRYQSDHLVQDQDVLSVGSEPIKEDQTDARHKKTDHILISPRRTKTLIKQATSHHSSDDLQL